MTSRRWVFTINNPEGLLELDGWGVTACVYQEEVGESGTHHLQGYVKFETPRRAAYVERVLGGHAHLESARGSHAECIEYCTKAETRVGGPYWFPSEEEVRAEKQGRRTDLEEMCAAIKAGQRMSEVADLNPSAFVRNCKGLVAYSAVCCPPQDREKVFVVCLHGPPGIGKTTAVHRLCSESGRDSYTLRLRGAGALWFDGYSGQDVLIIDDFTGADQVDYASFNAICDRWAYSAPVKGSFVAARWTFVFVLTNDDPAGWYPVRFGLHNDHADAVLRRVGYGKWAGVDADHRYQFCPDRPSLLGFIDSLLHPPASPVPAVPDTPDLDEEPSFRDQPLHRHNATVALVNGAPGTNN